MLERSLKYIGWIAVLAVALWLRIDDLDARPSHFDEATGAFILAERFEAAGYHFDPTHFHGPFLSLSSVPIAKLFAEDSWREFTITMLRTSPLLAGMLLVLTPLLWLRVIGPRAALAASALLASSPLLVYYNRMYIHESWVALFGMITAAAIFYFIKGPTRKRALLAGLGAGLMFATKGTVAISLLCWALAGLATWWIMRYGREENNPGNALTDYIRPALWFTLSLIITAAVFYGGGLIDAFKTYFVYETTSGHDKPFGYYLHMLIWPKQALGVWWTEGGVALLGLAAGLFALQRKRALPLVGFVTLSVLLHLLVYSLIHYKTPWLMSLPWALACLLAACIFLKDFRVKGSGRAIILYSCFGLCLFYQIHLSLQANGRLSNHADNPYAYVPTSKNISQLPTWLKELEGSLEDQSLEPIAVIGQSFWPLPWYLREFEQVGYWPLPPEGLNDLPVVIAMPEQTAACNEMLGNTHTQLPRTLRSNVAVSLYLKNDIWEAWTAPKVE